MWGQAHEGWKVCSEGGVWQKYVGLGGDLATAHGHTRWLGATCCTTRKDGSFWIGVTSRGSLEYLQVIMRLKKDLEAQRFSTLGETHSRREERACTWNAVTPLSFFFFFAKLVEHWWKIDGILISMVFNGFIGRFPPMVELVENW